MYVSLVAFATFVIAASLGVVDARPRAAYVAPADCSISDVTYAPPVTFTQTAYSTVTATVTVHPERKRLTSLLQLHFDKRQETDDPSTVTDTATATTTTTITKTRTSTKFTTTYTTSTLTIPKFTIVTAFIPRPTTPRTVDRDVPTAA